jgi:hypothetical protein
MTEYLYSGTAAALLGALVGAWIAARLNFGFQKKLLDQQLAFQKALLEQQLSAQEDGQKKHLEYWPAPRKLIQAL